MALVVFTGGARSGKSSAAEMLARSRQALGAPVVVAVFGHAAQGADAEFAQRIERHQADRPAGFETLEAEGNPTLIASVPDDALLIVDCLGTLLGRLMEAAWSRVVAQDSLSVAAAEELPEGFEDAVVTDLEAVIGPLLARAGDTIVVTNEVGDGVVPAYATGRLFRDLLGRTNRRLVQRADAAYLAVAGRLLDVGALPAQARWPED